MKLLGLIPVINCQKIEETWTFYQQALGYIIINKDVDEQGQLCWLHIKSDNTELMLLKQADKLKNSIKSDIITLYYYTDDIETRYRFLSAKGFNPGKITTSPYGMQEMLVYDPEQNKLIIGQIEPTSR